MINQSTSRQLLLKLPLLAGQVTPEEIGLLARKWGVEDGQYHSTNWLIKVTGSNLSVADIKELENKAVLGITEVFNRIFSCPHCAIDLRKGGLQRKTAGYQISKSFVGPNGEITRDQDGAFSRDKSLTPDTFKCLVCGNWLPKGSAPTYFIGQPLNQQVVLNYLVNFVKLENPPQVNVPNILSTSYDDISADEQDYDGDADN